MNEQQHQRGFLKDRLGDFRADPPESVWSAITARLGNAGRRRRIIFALSAAATIALALTLGLHFLDRGLRGPVETVQLERSITGDEISPPDPGMVTPDPGMVPSEDISPSEATSPSEAISPSGEVSQREAIAHSGAGSLSESEEQSAAGTSPEAAPGIPDLPGAVDRSETGGRTVIATLTDEREQGPEPVETGTTADTTMPAHLLPVEEVLADDFGVTGREKEKTKWAVGASLSPIYSFRDAEKQLMTATGDYESGIISFAGGIRVSYRPLSRLAFETGVLFSKMGIAVSAPGIQMFKKSFDFAPLREETYSSNILAVSNSVGNIVSESGDIYVNNYKVNEFYAMNAATDNALETVYANEGIRQNLDYLEVPFNMRYSVIDGDLEVQLVGGMSTNFLVNSSVTMPTSAGQVEIGYLTNIRTVNYSGNAGVGVIYHLLDRLSLSLEPRFRYFINSINDQTLPSTRPYTFGVYTGLNYRF